MYVCAMTHLWWLIDVLYMESLHLYNYYTNFLNDIFLKEYCEYVHVEGLHISVSTKQMKYRGSFTFS